MNQQHLINAMQRPPARTTAQESINQQRAAAVYENRPIRALTDAPNFDYFTYLKLQGERTWQ